MSKLHLFLVALLALILSTSCTIEQTIDYRADMSGNNKVIIKYGGVLEQMSDLVGDSTGFDKEMDMSEFMGSLKGTFTGISGIGNLEVINKVEEKIMGFSLDFKDNKALNLAMAEYLKDEASPGKKKKTPKNYKTKKKALILNFDQGNLGSLSEGLGDPTMAAMLGLFDYSLTITLPRSIKSVSNPLYVVSEDRKSLSVELSFEDLSGGNEDLSVKIKW